MSHLRFVSAGFRLWQLATNTFLLSSFKPALVYSTTRLTTCLKSLLHTQQEQRNSWVFSKWQEQSRFWAARETIFPTSLLLWSMYRSLGSFVGIYFLRFISNGVKLFHSSNQFSINRNMDVFGTASVVTSGRRSRETSGGTVKIFDLFFHIVKLCF